jgi:hypothetical protein
MLATLASKRGGQILAIVSLALVCLGGRLAHAETGEGPASARAAAVAKLNSEGVAFYKAHDFRRAVERFLQAYATDSDPNLLFNIARCYEALNDPNAAAEKYKQYLSDPDAEPEGKRRAEAALQALERPRAGSAPASSPPATPEGRPAAAPGVAAGVTSGAPADGRRFGVWPVVALSAGVATAAVGAVFYILGAHDVSKVTGSPGFGNPAQVDPMTEGAARQLADSGRTRETIGVVALTLGGAALAAGAALFFLSTGGEVTGKDSAGAGLAFTPVVDTGGGRLMFSGRF